MDMKRLDELREETTQYRAVADDLCMSTQYEDDLLELIDEAIARQSVKSEEVAEAIAELRLGENAWGHGHVFAPTPYTVALAVTALRQYQKPTDEKISQAIGWQEAQKASAQNDWERAGAEWRMEPGAQEQHDEQMASFDLAIQALSQMRTEPDCSTAEWQGGYCLGYGKSDTDDEPCEVCKACPKQASYDDDKCEWCDKVLTLFTNSGKYIPENQPPRNYCPNCGRMVK